LSKTIVTHLNPDFDGISAIWLLTRFHPDFKNSKFKFVPAGSSLNGKGYDSDPDIVHVDTGGGPFDHHDSNRYTCAAKLVWEHIKKTQNIKDAAVERMIDLSVAYDHAKDLEWNDADHDKYDLTFPAILTGWKMTNPGQHEKYVLDSLPILDGLLNLFKAKVDAEKVIKNGKNFKTKWGKGLACLTKNEMIMHLAEKKGFVVVVRKDPLKGNVRIYSRGDKGVDLTEMYKLVQKKDPESDWFLHASNCLLLNGSSKNPGMRPTKLSLEKIVDILKKQ